MKKISVLILSSLLLIGLTACSSNKDNNPQLNNSNPSSTVEPVDTIEPQSKELHFTNYNDAYNHISEEGTKLINLLDKVGINYNSSSNNHFIISPEDSYEMYTRMYTQRFEFIKKMDGFSSDNSAILFEMVKEYHIQDDLTVDDSYFQLFYNIVKKYDNSFTPESLATKINDAKSNNEDLTFYSGENEIVTFYIKETSFILKAELREIFTLDKIEAESTNFKTVSEFFDKSNKYNINSDGYSISDNIYFRESLNEPVHNTNYSIYYYQSQEGDLSESYTFDLTFDPKEEVVIDESTGKTYTKLYDRLPNEIKSVIPQFFDIISEHVEFNIRDYITEEQFIGEIDTMMLSRAYSYSDSDNTYIGVPSFYKPNQLDTNLSISYSPYSEYEAPEFRDSRENISISITKPVIAEGKSVL